MRSREDSPQVLLRLGAAGALAVVALSALLYTTSAKKRRASYSKSEWLSAIEENGIIKEFEGVVDDVANKGIEASIRPEVWPFLLEVFDHASTYQQRQQQHQLMVRQYQQLLLQCQAYEAAWRESGRPQSPTAPSHAAPAGPEPVRQQQNHPSAIDQQHIPQQQLQLPAQVRQFAEAHRIIVIDAVRTDFQKHRAAVAQMQEHGSGYFSSICASNHGNAVDSGAYANTGVAAVANLVNQGLSALQQYWLGSLLGGQAAAWGHQQALWVSEAAQLVLENAGHMVADSKRQAARMIAMLSAYALHDPDIGYCQGMSDLLLPFVLLMEDDGLAFWCFVALMQQQGVRKNFAVDETGIFSQLRTLRQVLEVSDKPLLFRLHQLGAAECHFAYRMTIVMMRRDMPLHKVMLLWEVLWAKAWQQRKLGNKSVIALQDSKQAADKPLDMQNSTNSVTAGQVNISTADGGLVELTADSRESSKLQDPVTLVPQSSSMEFFTCFVAAVILSQRRQVLDHCYDADDVLRLFHGLKNVDVWQCLQKAEELRSSLSSQVQQ